MLEETERVQWLNSSQLKILIAELHSAAGVDAKTRTSFSPEGRLAFLAAWREWSATRPDFPAPPQSAQAVQAPDAAGHPVAKPAPGRAGFVFSPFNKRLVDVRGVPSGALVADPSAPPTERWIFRVP